MVFFDGGPSGGGATPNYGVLIDGVMFALDGTTAPATYPLNWGAVPGNNQVVHNGAHAITTNNTGIVYTTDQTTPPTSSW